MIYFRSFYDDYGTTTAWQWNPSGRWRKHRNDCVTFQSTTVWVGSKPSLNGCTGENPNAVAQGHSWFHGGQSASRFVSAGARDHVCRHFAAPLSVDPSRRLRCCSTFETGAENRLWISCSWMHTGWDWCRNWPHPATALPAGFQRWWLELWMKKLSYTTISW